MRIKKTVLLLALFIATLIPTFSLAANESNKNSSIRANELCSPCVLILFSYDPNKNWHVTRAAAYNNLENCLKMGDRFNKDMKRELDKKTQQTTSYYCLQADLP
jgi:hypothetical protein